MKKTLCILSIGFLAMVLCASAYAAVEPVITVNGMTGTVNVAADSAVTVRVQLSPGDKEGTDADWWLAGYAYGRWYYYQLSGNWNDIGSSLDISKLRPAYQGKLFALSASDVLKIPELPAGAYTLYFGVDTNMNGNLDTDSLVFKTIHIVKEGYNDVLYGGSGVSAAWPENNKQYYELPSIDPEDCNPPSSVAQAYKLLDFIPLRNGYGVRIIESGEEQHILRIVPLSDPENGQAVSELVLDEDAYSGTITNGNMLYLIFSRPMFFDSGNVFEYLSKQNTKIQVIDLSIPQTPVKRGSLELTGIYYPSVQTRFSPPINSGLIFQTNGSVLVLPYSKGKIYQGTPGEDLMSLLHNIDQALYNAEKRVRVLDFSDPDQPKEISDKLLSDVRGISGYFMNDRILYVSHFKNIDTGSPEYYLTKVDFSDLSEPLQSARVNIPAPCIGTDSSGIYAFTAGGCCGNLTFSSLKLGADNAEIADKMEIEGYGSNGNNIILSDGFAYLGGPGGMVIADVRNPEKLELYEYSENRSISIHSVGNRSVFVYSGNSFFDSTQYIICYDASIPQSLKVDSFFEKKGMMIYHSAFSDDTAYLSLGNYGLWSIKN